MYARNIGIKSIVAKLNKETNHVSMVMVGLKLIIWIAVE
jgi:hypothetical protein